MRINLILARAANGVIGLDGVMPWHLPEDMAHFKQQTMGAPVIMGRKTWDSIPPRFRATTSCSAAAAGAPTRASSRPTS